MRHLRILMLRDLRERKGIRWSRQHLHQKIKAGEFPPPDGKTGDAPTAPNFWFETTIDAWLKARAKAMSAKRAAATAGAATAA
jgi:predicted DNA-binding transcriptional regulator AlpA